MTAQPYQPVTDSHENAETTGTAGTTYTAGSADTAESTGAADSIAAEEDVVIAGAVEESEPDLAAPGGSQEATAGTGEVIVMEEVVGASPAAPAPGPAGTHVPPAAGASGGLPSVLDDQWHDIQAMFVDDPGGSVRLAAAAAEAAVAALVDVLRQRQAELAPAGTTGSPGDTEQLREALRGYRLLCQSVADLGQRLPQPEAMSH